MSRSLYTWIVLAVLLFWAVGAYNRLVRLRADARAAFGQVDTQLQQEVRLIESLLADDTPDSMFPGQGQSSFWEALRGAALQLSASLAAARVRPFDRRRIEALAAASGVLTQAWQRVEREDAHDLAGSRLPETLTARRAQLLAQAQAAIEQFNSAIGHYNAAIHQFPARLLARIFGFKPGSAL